VNKIDVQVKMFMNFKKYLPSESRDGRAVVSVQEGATLQDLMSMLGIPGDEQGTAVINGISYGVADTQVLRDGDVVSFFSPVAGG
jgi:molybdopterin converting factor small subunit